MIPFLKKLINNRKTSTTVESSVSDTQEKNQLAIPPVETAPLHFLDPEKLVHLQMPNTGSTDMSALHEIRMEPPQILVGCGHSAGQQRDHNEDSMFTITTTLVSDATQINFGLYIIADGMGGHQHGEIASGVAIRAMVSHVMRKIYVPYFSLSASQPDESLQEIMKEGVYEAHRAILRHAAGGGTTLSAALIMGDQMTISHVGDSRAYVIHSDGHMQVITRDHSLVKRLEELGQITAAEITTHPQRNVLYRALGQGEPFEPDISTFPLPRSGFLIICSDGLWGVVPEKEIFNIIASAPTPQQACQKLIDAANDAGGPDNISVLLIRIPD
jgi:PPM family protein phosphatase